MLGGEVGWVSKFAFFILKIKSGFGWCGPFIPISSGGRAHEWPEGQGAGGCGQMQSRARPGRRHALILNIALGWHYLLSCLIIFLF